MATQRFSLNTLDVLEDGRNAESFRKHLARAARDCEDRPADDSPRKVTLEVLITPVLDKATLSLDSVFVEVSTFSKVPAHRSKPYSMAVKADGTLAFNDLAPDNVHQQTIDE